MISQWKHDNKHGIGWDLAERHQAFQDVNDNSLKFIVKSEKKVRIVGNVYKVHHILSDDQQ